MPERLPFWIACAHCGKPLALAEVNNVCWCSKDCADAYRVTQRLTENKPAEDDKALAWESLKQAMKSLPPNTVLKGVWDPQKP